MDSDGPVVEIKGREKGSGIENMRWASEDLEIYGVSGFTIIPALDKE